MKKYILYPVLMAAMFMATARNSLALLPFGIYVGPRAGAGFGGKNESSEFGGKTVSLKYKTPVYVGLTAGIRLFDFRFDLEYS
ncbi:MAG: hypothetical protein LBB24_03705, partial [Rickettsiales bacterium]|nr:hypothetical protein [Rickettsiales bacterium]